MRYLTLSCCLLLFCTELAARAGSVPCPCEAPSAVRQELARLDFPNDAAMTDEERAAQRQAILSALSPLLDKEGPGVVEQRCSAGIPALRSEFVTLIGCGSGAWLVRLTNRSAPPRRSARHPSSSEEGNSRG
jgi:hypothetical protein